ncbi:MAG: outer membrane beta-barrel protein [Bacteroidota bacterium]
MKIVAVCVCTMLAAGAPAGAQAPEVRFGLQATGASINVQGPLQEAYGPGFGGGVHLDVEIGPWSVRAVGDYMRFSPDNAQYRTILARWGGGSAEAYTLSGGEMTIISAGVNLQGDLLPLPVFSPYLTGGGGLGRITVADASVSYNGAPVGSVPGLSSETRASANVGAGVKLSLGVDLYLEARHTWIFTEGESSTYIPVSLGITF